MAVSNVHYEVLHSLEDEGVLDPSDSIHLFCAQHVFLPRLQRDLNGIERLWRDVWMAVSNVHYEVLHSLEDEGVLDPSDSIHLFCAQHVFLPRLQRDLNGLG
ncbi:hypothetical protein NQZ68_031279 [Dissostichus eleginoides]|nr:hypothetical protein NQZ68_031279 [Dissostichus eleginoides]